MLKKHHVYTDHFKTYEVIKIEHKKGFYFEIGVRNLVAEIKVFV